MNIRNSVVEYLSFSLQSGKSSKAYKLIKPDEFESKYFKSKIQCIK